MYSAKFIYSFVYYLLVINGMASVLCNCDCRNDTTSNSALVPSEEAINCFCSGSVTILINRVQQNVNILTLSEFNYVILNACSLNRFKDNLVDVYISQFYELKFIEKNTFNELSQLRSLYISEAPLLSSLQLDIFEKQLPKLRFLGILHTGITQIPKLQMTQHLMDIIDLEGNLIETIESNSISVIANQIILDHNEITSIEGWAFNNSEIFKISLKGNKNLRMLNSNAFLEIKSLTVLDLSETSILNIPTNGLKELETLIIRHAYTMKTIPSVYDFDNLKNAELTFSFHCCAFHLPRRHDLQKYIRHKEQVEKIKSFCQNVSKSQTLAETSQDKNQLTTTVSPDEEWFESSSTNSKNGLTFRRKRGIFLSALSLQLLTNKSLIAFCGSVRFKNEYVQCSPLPDAFNPCEDIMGSQWLRVSVWIVVLTGLVGNSCVLAVILYRLPKITVQSFLICNLAFSDLCMAMFLLFLAIEDLISEGFYFNYAYDWQQGFGCHVAGFVTIFSSQLSIFVLCLLTVERWFTIKRALYSTQLDFPKIAFITVIGWVYSIVMAGLPLLGISSYSTTSLCLPMKTDTATDTIYIILLLSFASTAFIVICVCYYQIYFSLSYETRHKDGEYVLARKITILVSTNFICWAPITFFAFTAVLHFPLINITNSKILLVFFYPLNSCANPFLYAILTTNFKRDFTYLLSKCGICKQTARKYNFDYHSPNSNGKQKIQRQHTTETTL